MFGITFLPTVVHSLMAAIRNLCQMTTPLMAGGLTGQR
jgi:hypothetical protein